MSQKGKSASSSGFPFLRHALECGSKREICKFEQILCQFKEETRRLSSAKSRVDDAEMAQKTPKLRIREFLRHTLVNFTIYTHFPLVEFSDTMVHLRI